MRRGAILALVALMPVTALAQDAATGEAAPADGAAAEAATEAPELRPAPDYFVETIVALSIAQQVARSCQSISIDPVAAQAGTVALIERLEADGFDTNAPHTQMIDPSEETVALQQAFMAKHSLAEGIGEEQVCAAGAAEIAEGSELGGYLVELEN